MNTQISNEQLIQLIQLVILKACRKLKPDEIILWNQIENSFIDKKKFAKYTDAKKLAEDVELMFVNGSYGKKKNM